jgi:nucleotide-binding universal stress UspA family protein
MSVGEPISKSTLSDATESEARRQGTSERNLTHAGTLPDSREEALEAVAKYVENESVGLVLSDPLPNHARGPEATGRWDLALLDRLDCPVFMVDACANPERVERILVPTDLSAASGNTLKHAVRVANCYDASLVLLHVLEASPYVALTPMDRLSLGDTTLSEHRARRRLHSLVKEVGAAGGEIRPRIVFGAPAEQITRFVDEKDVDLVVLSSHGASVRPDRSSGSVTDQVLRRLACPIFLVPSADETLLAAERSIETENHGGESNESSVSSSR